MLVLLLLLLLGFALLAYRARGGRVSRLVLTLFAVAWSEDRLDRKAEQRRRMLARSR